MTTPATATSRPSECPSAQAAAELSTLDAELARLCRDRIALLDWLAGFRPPRAAAAVAARSYWHHNGFAKLVLRIESGHRVRLHVWPPGENRRGENNPHAHRWNFVSTVLCGDGLRSRTYRESAGGIVHEKFRYAGERAAVPFVRTGSATLTEDETRVIGPRETHRVDTSLVHTVRPLGTALVATLLVQGVRRTETTTVYCRPGRPVHEPVAALTGPEVTALVTAVHSALTADPRAGERP